MVDVRNSYKILVGNLNGINEDNIAVGYRRFGGDLYPVTPERLWGTLSLLPMGARGLFPSE
jgi:hypothetical protein